MQSSRLEKTNPLSDTDTLVAMQKRLASMREKAAAAAEAGEDMTEFELEAEKLQLLLDLLVPMHSSLAPPGGLSN